MKIHFALFLAGSMLALFSYEAFCISQDAKTQHETSYVKMNIGLEISGLEKAASEAAQGLNLIGGALQNLANRPELSTEQHQQIKQTLSHIDQLGESLTQVVEQLPVTIEKSAVPILNTSKSLSEQIRRIILLSASVLILILLVALAAVYYFVLAPGTRAITKTTTLLNELSDTLKTTAEIVETSSKRNLQVMEEITKTQTEQR